MSFRSHWIQTALASSAVVCACGGGSINAPLTGAEVAPAPAPPDAPAYLASSNASMALAVTGQPRQFVITNVGGQDANSLVASTTTLPPGTFLQTDCTALAPGASCTITIVPGAVPSAAPGDTAPVPAGLLLSGSNTNTLALSVWVLDHGSVYQGGYVFDLNDGTPALDSVGGKVLALGDAWPTDLQAHDLPSTSNTDGATNTATLVSAGGGSPSTPYAAWACDVATDAGLSDWYLPAICEMGYETDFWGTGCGSVGGPRLQNIQSNLVDKGVNTGVVQGRDYWSSSSTGAGTTWFQRFGAAPVAVQRDSPSGLLGLARCVRALTP